VDLCISIERNKTHIKEKKKMDRPIHSGVCVFSPIREAEVIDRYPSSLKVKRK
jgi:hypothetical protein